MVSLIGSLAVTAGGVASVMTAAPAAANTDLPSPSWWNGSCDDGRYFAVTGRHSYPLGASFLGVAVCGPRPGADGAPDVLWTRAGWGEYEFECTELAFRFMSLAYGISTAWNANGNTVVANYNSSYGGGLVKVSNGTVGSAPHPGDVISFTSTTSPNGHVAVVASSTVDGSGNGSLQLLSQNDTANGWRTLPVSNWTVGGFASYSATAWLHQPGWWTGATASEGGFVARPNGEVYRIAGGAPVYVSSWAAVGGQQAVTQLTDAQFAALPQYPADGSLVSVNGLVYVMAGGAPIYVSSWAAIGGVRPAVVVDPAAIANAGGPSPYDHVRLQPKNGTLVNQNGSVYVIAGGAPIWIHSWAAVGGPQASVTVDPAAITNAGLGFAWSHLNQRPADGTTMVETPSGRLWQATGGMRDRLDGSGPSAVAVNDGDLDPIPQVGAGYHALTSARILDSRIGQGLSGPLGPGQTADLQVTGQGGVPVAGVSAVVLNVTVTQPTDAGWITVWPAGVAMPTASNLNFSPGQTVPNLVTVKVGAGGRVSLFNSSGSTQLIADVVGWYDDGTQNDARLHVVTPARILDSRIGQGLAGPLGPGQTADLQVTGQGGVPVSGVSAVVLNVTVTDPAAAGYLTVWPAGVAMPTASNLNFSPGQTVPNLVVVKVGAGGMVSLFNSGGSTQLVADVVGWFG